MIDKTDGKNPIKREHLWWHTRNTLAPHGLNVGDDSKSLFTCIYILLVPYTGLLRIIIPISILLLIIIVTINVPYDEQRAALFVK